MKKFWLIILLIISLMLVGYLIYMIFFYTSVNPANPSLNQGNVNQNINAQANFNQNANSQDICLQLELQAGNLIQEANYCQADSDCLVGEGFSCPFGCYHLYNKNADLTEIKTKVDAYFKVCPYCANDCPTTPEASQVKCLEGKCVDTRFIR